MSERERPASEPLVVIESLTKSFEHMGRTLNVLKGIDLTIYPGQIMAIVGASGAGKSTLLHCIGTLDLPTTGRIRLAGEELTTMSSSRLAAVRNREIGFVFQFHHLLPEFNALENLMIPGLIQRRSKKEMEKRARALLEEVGLSERATHRPGELSGGEQQRVALARAIINSPAIILADEPTGNLDTENSQIVLDMFRELNQKYNQTIIMITHNPEAAAVCSRIIRMRDGLVEEE